jgi:hypothetical protein
MMIPTQLTIAPFVDGEMAMMILVELKVDVPGLTCKIWEGTQHLSVMVYT